MTNYFSHRGGRFKSNCSYLTPASRILSVQAVHGADSILEHGGIQGAFSLKLKYWLCRGYVVTRQTHCGARISAYLVKEEGE